jgi:predicted Zn-dependent protease
LAGCSTNPATGENQLNFISSKQEERMGAKEHDKIIKLFGEVENPRIKRYVSEVGARLAANTERSDVRYKFFVLDSSMVNAFALPGGYVYITRGVLALANSEAELAAVLAHEIGHITARHSAERYSQNILASIGTLAVALATDSPDATRAANLGSNLFLKSYSRSQEHQSDELGIRYLNKANYDGFAMAGFLKSMDATLKLDSLIKGKKQAPVSYFSTHPQTEDRVSRASSIATSYSKGMAKENRESYLNIVNGMDYGDSAKQGFLLGRTFYGLFFSYSSKL